MDSAGIRTRLCLFLNYSTVPPPWMKLLSVFYMWANTQETIVIEEIWIRLDDLILLADIFIYTSLPHYVGYDTRSNSTWGTLECKNEPRTKIAQYSKNVLCAVSYMFNSLVQWGCSFWQLFPGSGHHTVYLFLSDSLSADTSSYDSNSVRRQIRQWEMINLTLKKSFPADIFSLLITIYNLSFWHLWRQKS